MRTIQEWVDLFETPAYIFCNGFTNKYMYFIPICEHTDVVVNPDFDAFSFTQVKNGDEVVCDLQNLIHKSILMGDEHIFFVPLEFNDADVPEENVIYPVKKS